MKDGFAWSDCCILSDRPHYDTLTKIHIQGQPSHNEQTRKEGNRRDWSRLADQITVGGFAPLS